MSINKYLSLDGLKEYDTLIKVKITETGSDSISYTDEKIENMVGLSSVEAQINAHNVYTSAHNDIRAFIVDLETKLNNFLDVDDATSDQLSEVLTLIANNKGTLESITTNKINVDDIVDNLTTAVASKVLSANQGVIIKGLIDALQKELDDHSHAIEDISGLQHALDGKAASSHGTHVTYSTTAPLMDGTASAGSASAVARSDHKHPTDTTRASKTDLDELKTALNKKANDYSIELYNGTGGNPKPVKFTTVNYSTCNSENGVAIKIGMVSGHGNGTSYAFLEDAIIRVTHTGNVEVDNFKYYGAETTYDGARQYGDIFWVNDTTNKIVDFYCLMGQYARVNMIPYKRLTYSSGGSVTQYTSCTVYSSGTREWANSSNIALTADLNSAISTKADAYHTHSIDNVTSLKDTLDGKVMQADFDAHKDSNMLHTNETERLNWNSAYTHSQTAHAPSDAQPNQNAFSNIAVSGQSTISADTTTDTLTLAGNNVAITTDVANDKVTISVADGSTSAKGIVQLTDSTSNTSTTTAATPNSVKLAYDLANQAKTAAATAQETAEGKAAASHSHTVSNITDLTATAIELNYMDGVTSNVQTQLDNKAKSVHTHTISNVEKLQDTLDAKVPTSRTVNGKPLSDNISLSPADVGAAPSSHSHNDLYYTVDEINTQIDALEEELKTHTHAIEDISGLQHALDGKAASSHGIHVSYSDTDPMMDGTASAGSASTVARSDHKHPTDTSRASKTEFDSHNNNTTKHITSTERTNWNAAKTHADSAHAPSNAEKNQNAFSNIKVGSITVAADAATDTLELVGDNVTITPDATNDKITIAVAISSTSEAGIVKLTNSTSSTSTTTAATPSSVKSAYDLANQAKTNAATAQTMADDAYTLAESKADSLSDLGVTATAAELNKMDGVTATTTELNYVDGVTSNIQTQLNGKQATITGGATTIASSNLTASRALISNSSGKVAVSDVTSTELGYLDGVTSSIQTQLNAKAASDHTHSEYMTTTDPVGTGSFSMNRLAGTTVGTNSFAFGSHCEASGSYSFACGAPTPSYPDPPTFTSATAYASFAEGIGTTSSGTASHAEGNCTTASGSYSHAEGIRSTASGSYSHAEGYQAKASGEASHAEGYCTTADKYQHASGKYNAKTTAPNIYNTQDSTNKDAVFMVGCGTMTAAKNAFRVSSGGKCFSSSAFEATGADFAELFEWTDGNPNNEDRRGLFVALDGEKIRLANAKDDYIGVISGAQAFIGNSASEEWHDKYLTDVFGTKLSQEVEVPEEVDEMTGEVIAPATITTQYILNPDYNPDEEYIMRENRKEWGIVGLLGQIVMIDDGTCIVGGRVEPSANGIGTASNNGYRVMKRIDENHIKVLVK